MRRPAGRLLACCLLLFATGARAGAAPGTAPGVTQFTPQGEIATVRQVVASFGTDMVRFGDPRVSNPFLVSCVAKGRGRWVNTRIWAYDFAQDVPLSHSCTFTLPAGIKDVNGQPLQGPRQFAFNTSPLRSPPPPTPAGMVSLDYFVPQGSAGPVRQVQARFSEDMVNLGDPRLRNPFAVDCPVVGQGRWVDPRNWVLDFSADLPPGIACNFTIISGLKSLAGHPMKPLSAQHFDTGGPRLGESRPWGGELDENQIFLIKFEGMPDQASLAQAGYCTAEGINERIPLRYMGATEAAALLAQLPPDTRRWWAEGAGDAQYRRFHQWEVVSCGRQLPPGVKASVVFDRSLRSAAGIANVADQKISFEVRPAFSASFHCTRENARKPCEPIADMQLSFTEDVAASLLQQVRLQAPGQSIAPQPNGGDGKFVDGRTVRFAAPFAANAAMQLSLPAGFVDVSNRPLTNAAHFPLNFRTATYPPLAKFAADFGVVELAAGAVPLTIRNLQELPGAGVEGKVMALRVADDDAALVGWLQRFRAQQNCAWCTPRDNQGNPDGPDPRSVSQLSGLPGVTVTDLPKAGPRDFEVLGLPVPKPGVYVHEVESRYLGESLIWNKAPMYVSAMSVVTNLGVHLRIGRQDSLVWVTTLDKARPVPAADVSLWDCRTARQLWQGRTDGNGLVAIPGDPASLLPQRNDSNPASCQGSAYVVIARSGNDRGMVLPNWTEGIDSWRFGLPYGESSGQLVAHTVLDRSLFRAGETVHMRHVVRELGLRGLMPPSHQHFTKLEVVFNGGTSDDEPAQEFPLPLNIDANGDGDSEWVIPKDAKLGSYSILLDGNMLGSFRVEEFRLPSVKASLQLPPGPLVAPATVPADMQLHFLNGGGFGNAPVTLRAHIGPGSMAFDGLEGYSFFDYGDPNAGNNRTRESSGEYGGDEEDEGAGPVETSDDARGVKDQDLPARELKLDASGGARADNGPIPPLRGIASYHVEMEYRDPSGETHTEDASTTLWPAAVMPGIHVPDWVDVEAKNPLEVDVVTVGPDGKPRGNVTVAVTAEMHTTQTHRRRIVGGFYAYDSVSQSNQVPVDCAGSTDAGGRLHCRLKANVSGELYLRAVATDAQGHSMSAGTSVWVENGARWWFPQANDDRIDLIPEKKEYQPGETVRLQARMPFPQATALICVERDGVLKSFVQQLDSKQPVITLPVENDYAPNVFVSAFLIRGRDDSVAPTALVDLGKPAFKLGVANINVGWDSFRLGVNVKTDRPRYHPRDKAQVTVQVSPPRGQALPPHTEVTLAAVDEALLQLQPNDSYDVLTPMMQPRGYGMETATSQLQVVGKRHYGRKALPSGGGGGRGFSTRQLFDTLLYWQARAPVDANGQATFTVPLNDSLTGFRLVATAVSAQRFGSGQTRMESYQDVQILSGLPLVVRQGDRLDPAFTVRNASTQKEQLHFSAAVDGLGTLLERDIAIDPGQSAQLGVPFTVPKDTDSLKWTVSASGGGVGDRMETTEKVYDPVPERVLQGTLAQLEQPIDMPVQKPADALPGGGVRVLGRARLSDSLDSVKKYFRDYLYWCLEQKTSKAVGLQDPAMWADVMNNLPTYLDANGLAAFFPPTDANRLSGSSFLTSYILSVSHAIGWEIPAASRDRMLGALVALVEGRLQWPDHTVMKLDGDARKLEVFNVLAQYGRFKPAYLGTLTIDPARWSTPMLIDWLELVKAAPDVPDRQNRIDQAQMLLRTHTTLQGSALLLSEGNFNWWWLYENSGSTEARLMLATMDLPAWKEDEPRLLRGLLMQQHHGAWDTTVANLWGGIALKRFGEQFESVPVSGQTQVSMGGQQKALDWSAPQPAPVQLDWPAAADTVHISQAGTGKPWITVQAVARVPLKAPLSTGFTVDKKVTPLMQKVAGRWSAGDVARVDIRVDAQSDIGWVALDDPIPAGGTLLERGLGGEGVMLPTTGASTAPDATAASEEGEGGDYEGGAWPAYVEYGAAAYRSYYEWVAKGRFQASYLLRLNQSGTFQLPPTRVEAMYAPEMFGMVPNAPWTVVP